MLEPDFEQRMRERLASASFSKWMGIELVSLDDGASEIRMKVEPHHRNPGGIAHGGIIATMLDVAVGVALRTRLGMTSQHVTVNLSIDYLRAAAGDVLIARGRAIKDGRRITFGEATLHDEQGRDLARASASFLVLPERPITDGPMLDGE
jgi:uncharacterized protein (TIGR00369 family)